MYHTRPRYFTLGDLQATLKLSYLWSGPTDQSYANNVKVKFDGFFGLSQKVWLIACRKA